MDRARGPRPSSASVQVRELSWQGQHNPRPQSKAPGSHGGGCSELLMEEYLSPARLRALAQMPDLRLVSMLEMCVDTREHSLGNFGLHLPSLSQLKLNGSRLGSVRDLGTSLGRLQVLWLTRCGLGDLDGIGSFPALKELYASYNCISDLSPLCLLEQLEVLDLEGNGVEDLGQVCYLQLCPRLATLTLEGNLVCVRPGLHSEVPQGYDYRVEVRRLIPQLQVLDELPATHTSLPASRKLDQDWLVVKTAIQEGRVLDGLLPTLDGPHGDPIWRLSPERSLPETQPQAPGPWPLALPKDLAPEGDASNLTHGAGRVLCGNPTKGLRERRHRCQARAPPDQLLARRPGSLATRASPLEPDPADSRDLLALGGLQAWRGLCLRQLESWQEEAKVPRGPQRGPEEQEDETGPKTSPSPPSMASEPSRTSGYNLLPTPPKLPMPPDSSSPWGSTDLQFRGRRLRALGSSGPGLNQRLAAMAALRALEVASGPSPRDQGCPDPAARHPALRCLPPLNPITPAQSHP
ncbi:leucine-rich repeat-containing protein 56 [Hipposideros larvatus]